MKKNDESSEYSWKGKEENAEPPKRPEVVFDGPRDSGISRVEDYEDEKASIKNEKAKFVSNVGYSNVAARVSIPRVIDEDSSLSKNAHNSPSTKPQASDVKGRKKTIEPSQRPEIVTDGPRSSGISRVADYFEEEESVFHGAATVSTITEGDEDSTPPKDTSNTPRTVPNPSSETTMVEAYLVPDEEPTTIAAQVIRAESMRFTGDEDNFTSDDTNKDKSVVAKREIGTFEKFFKTNDGKIKKRCWAIAAAVVVSIIIGIIFSTQSASSDNENVPSSPSISQMPSSFPSFQPTASYCIDTCLAQIEVADCPEDASQLNPCYLSEVTDLCMDDRKCMLDSSSPSCNTDHQIYRRKACPIDEPWKRSFSGFEYFIETHAMDWESHQERARQFNASLASILTQGELNFVNNMLSNTNESFAFIGGLRKKDVSDDPLNDGTSKFWEWEDTSPWDFANWDTNEPNGVSNGQSRESVVSINKLKLVDVLPTSYYPAVYKRKYSGINNITFSLGNLHSCASNLEDELFCWGLNIFGQIGEGSTDVKYNPTKINLDKGRTMSKISLGRYHTCATLNDGNLNCWGNNEYGQLGDGTKTHRMSPTEIDIGNDRSTTQVSLRGEHTCIVLDNGTVKCWGLNSDGQLGDGTNVDKMSPTNIVAVGNQGVQIDVGSYHTCSLLKGGKLKCWGQNTYGQLGDNTTANKIYPTDIEFDDGRTVEKIVTGYYHTCALLNDNTMWCWGLNAYGQLGDNTTTNRNLPTRIIVDEVRKIKDVAVGGAHTCAVLSDGALKCWGYNNNGQLGDGTTIHKKYPTEINVGVGKTVSQITLGGFHTCATLDYSTLRCWGQNDHGQLGVGTNTDQIDAFEVQYVAI